MNWLLLRGLSREQRHWGAFPDALQSALGGEVRCIDAPGFGTECARRSPATIGAITDDIRARFDPGGGEWSILGISLGGMVALDWSARYPSDFSQCVVINTSALVHRRFRLGSLPALASGRFRSPISGERAILAISSNNRGIDRESLAAQWAEWAQESRPADVSISLQGLAAIRFRPPRSISIPLLVLASRGDRLVSYRCSERIATRLGGTLRLHETAGHDLPLDDPEWICKQIGLWSPSGASR